MNDSSIKHMSTLIDIIYMKDCGGFINIKELEEVWDNSYFMKGFKNIEDFVSNECGTRF